MGDLTYLAGQFADQTDEVKFVAVVDDDTNPAVLGVGGWVDVPFSTFVTTTEAALSEAYARTHDWDDYPVYPLIDLQTMEVLWDDCQDYPQPGDGWLLPCVRDHLER